MLFENVKLNYLKVTRIPTRYHEKKCACFFIDSHKMNFINRKNNKKPINLFNKTR